MSKKRPADSNTYDPAFLKAWEAHRYTLRPKQCDMGEGGHVCWVKQPYDAMPHASHRPHCTGCKGKIGLFFPEKYQKYAR